MELLDLKSVTKTVAKKLRIDDLTVEKLATTTAPILAKIRGISLKGAGQIIAEAQELTNKSGLKKSQKHQPLQGITFYDYPVAKKMSRRVRRAKAAKARSK